MQEVDSRLPRSETMHQLRGELLAIAIALHKCRFLVYGHPNLVVLTDHKPLVGFLNSPYDKETENRRMLNLRRKTDNYSFKTQYVPSFQIGASDGISRREPEDEGSIPSKDWATINQVASGICYWVA